jgi:hypothetical protein
MRRGCAAALGGFGFSWRKDHGDVAVVRLAGLMKRALGSLAIG